MDIDKAKKYALSREDRNSTPLDSFIEKIDSSRSLLLFVNDEINQKMQQDSFPLQISRELKKILIEAKNQFVITLISALEVYLKDTFIDIIDYTDIDYSKLTYKYDLNTIANLLSKKVSIGFIIAEEYNFQNLNSINKAFSMNFKNQGSI